jgi:hypothetical protein
VVCIPCHTSEVVACGAGDLDPSSLSHLPPSMQMEVLTKFRDQQITRNRATFQKASADAGDFSAIQMASYLERTAFRRKMDAARDAASGAARTTARPLASQSDGSFILREGTSGASLDPCRLLQVNSARRSLRNLNYECFIRNPSSRVARICGVACHFVTKG